ncbi:hypothetical protein L195_g048978, partial [Trifolium pratense]
AIKILDDEMQCDIIKISGCRTGKQLEISSVIIGLNICPSRVKFKTGWVASLYDVNSGAIAWRQTTSPPCHKAAFRHLEKRK